MPQGRKTPQGRLRCSEGVLVCHNRCFWVSWRRGTQWSCQFPTGTTISLRFRIAPRMTNQFFAKNSFKIPRNFPVRYKVPVSNNREFLQLGLRKVVFASQFHARLQFWSWLCFYSVGFPMSAAQTFFRHFESHNFFEFLSFLIKRLDDFFKTPWRFL